MKISVVGLEYVGAVAAGCLAKNGHDVVGADIDARKHAETVVVGNADEELLDLPRFTSERQVVADLCRISKGRSVAGVYEGLCW